VKKYVVMSMVMLTMACTHTVRVETKEPITININVKIDHEIRVKVDKELDNIFSEDSNLF
jgi:CxxC motif-containing protein